MHKNFCPSESALSKIGCLRKIFLSTLATLPLAHQKIPELTGIPDLTKIKLAVNSQSPMLNFDSLRSFVFSRKMLSRFFSLPFSSFTTTDTGAPTAKYRMQCENMSLQIASNRFFDCFSYSARKLHSFTRVPAPFQERSDSFGSVTSFPSRETANSNLRVFNSSPSQKALSICA